MIFSVCVFCLFLKKSPLFLSFVLPALSLLPGAFIVCWTPGLVILLLDVFCASCNVLTYEKFFLLLAEFNSAMNPIIYSYRDKEMSATNSPVRAASWTVEQIFRLYARAAPRISI